MAQMIKTIKINEYQTGKAVGNTKKPKWLIRTKLIPASNEPLVGKKHPQGLTYGKGNPTQEIVGELLMNGTLVAHIGQGWREPIVPARRWPKSLHRQLSLRHRGSGEVGGSGGAGGPDWL